MIPALALAFASVCAILAFASCGIFQNWITDARAVGIVLGLAVASHWHKWKTPTLKWPIVAFVATVFIPTLWSYNVRLSVVGFPGLYSGSLITYAMCLVGFMLAEQIDNKHRDHIKQAIWCAGTLTVIVSVAQICRSDPFGMGPVVGSLRAMGFLGSPVDLGAMLVVLLSFCPRSIWPIYAVGVWTSGSRGAWVASLVSITPRKWKVPAFAAATVLCMGCLAVSHSQTDLGRKAIWGVAAESITVFGHGPSTFYLTFWKNWGRDRQKDFPDEKINPIHSHNAILEALVTRGIFGLIGLLLIFKYLPELSALWSICMFNPVSFEVVFVACVLAGLYRKENHGPILVEGCQV